MSKFEKAKKQTLNTDAYCACCNDVAIGFCLQCELPMCDNHRGYDIICMECEAVPRPGGPDLRRGNGSGE